MDEDSGAPAMDDLQRAYQDACALVTAGGAIPDADKLRLYGLYTLVSRGRPCATTSRAPSRLFSPTAHAKYNAWVEASTLYTHSHDAQRAYIDIVSSLSISDGSDGFGIGVKKPSSGFDLPNDVDNDDDFVITPILQALHDEDTLLNLIHNMPIQDINTTDTDGLTILMRAADRGLPRAVEALLRRGADRSLTDNDGMDALAYARLCGHDDTARTLLQTF